MSDITDELQKLYRLLESGAITTEEYEQAKSIILKQESASDGAIEKRLLEVEFQNELLQIDRDWEAESKQYLSSEGLKPSCVTGLFLAIASIILVIAGVWMLAASNALTNPISLLFALLFVFVGIWAPLSYFQTYQRYEKAREIYRLRRAEARDRYQSKL